VRRYKADVAIIGAGPAGLAAAVAAESAGASVLVLERNAEPGGVLMQCIHSGFGVKVFGEELTGPEYAWRWIERLGHVDCLLDTMVLAIEPGFEVLSSSSAHGLLTVHARSVVLAMGCRERTRGSIRIAGTRPAGIMTAGTAQRLVNISGYLPGRRFAVLGSGDIGMIMARRLTWEGAEVAGVYEVMPYLSGLRRNYVQCLLDYEIPLHLSHTVTEIHGARRVSAVTVSEVDSSLQPLPGSAARVAVDSLLLSVGLIPENELTRGIGAAIDPVTGGPMVDDRMQTSIRGLYAAGNVVHVHDLADDVSQAGEIAGREAARYALGGEKEAEARVRVLPGENVRSVVPQLLRLAGPSGGEVQLFIRARWPIEARCRVELVSGGTVLQGSILPYARPGESVNLRLRRSVMDQLTPGRDLVVHLVKQ